MSSSDKSHVRWCEWVKRRVSFVGAGNQRQLATKVGCSPEHLSRWMQLNSPPQMRRGYDIALAVSLKTNPAMLLNGWRDTPPEDAPIENAAPADPDILRRKIVAVAELLPPEKLHEFFSEGQRLLTSQSQVA